MIGIGDPAFALLEVVPDISGFAKLVRDVGLNGSQHRVLRILPGEGRPMRCDAIRRLPVPFTERPAHAR